MRRSYLIDLPYHTYDIARRGKIVAKSYLFRFVQRILINLDCQDG